MSDQDFTDFEQAFEADADDSQPLGEPEGRLDSDDPGLREDLAGEDGGDPTDPTADAGRTDAPPAEGTETTDDFAGLSESELREKAKALAAEVQAERDGRTRAENTLRSNEGRFSRAERELNELRLRQQAATPAQEEKPAGPEGVSDEVLSQVAEEYGDIGKPLVDHLRFLQAQVEELSNDRTQAAAAKQEEAKRELEAFLGKQQGILDGNHSDWPAIVASEAYGAWCAAQDPWIQELIFVRNGQQIVDGEAASFVFGKFKADTATGVDPNAERRERQLRGNAHVPARAPAMEPTGKGSGTFEDEFELARKEDERRASRGSRK